MEKQSSVARGDGARGDGAVSPAGSEEQWRALGEANVRLVRGMLAVWQRELELGQELMNENFADPGVITEFFSGSMAVGSRWSAAHRRFDHAVQAMRRINDEFYECLFDAAAMASGNGHESSPHLGVAGQAREVRAARSS
ncbi:MAG: hypothetical protein ACREEU_01610 [Acetobacteraceae bacterium]